MDIIFVILHYLTADDTIACVESIKTKIDTSKYKIIIVDNASKNGSSEILLEKYSSDDDVCILINETNLGFAKGLNIGINAAKKYNPDYIITANNDTILLSTNLYQVLVRKSEKYNYSVAGPMIITKDSKCNSNPINKYIRTIKNAEDQIKRYKRVITISKMHLYWLRVFKHILPKPQKTSSINVSYLSDQLNYKLHGAFWIFSKTYFETFDGLDDRTFLYGEESLLYLHLMENHMTTLYTPEIMIYHKEDSSTDALVGNSRKKTIFYCTESNKSAQIYIETYKMYQAKNNK